MAGIALIAPGNYIANLGGGGCTTVVTAGTRVQVSSSSFACEGVCIQALETNTGQVAVGGVDVVAAANSTRVCFCVLAPGASAVIPIKDLIMVYVDSTASGDIISYGPLR